MNEVILPCMVYEKPEDFGWEIIMDSRKLAEPAGFHADVIPLTVELQHSCPYDEYLLRNDYRGGFFMGLSLRTPWLKDFKQCSTPTVLYDNHVKTNHTVAYIGVDNNEGMDLAISHLKALGHRRIGYLSTALGSFVYQVRYTAFFRAFFIGTFL